MCRAAWLGLLSAAMVLAVARTAASWAAPPAPLANPLDISADEVAVDNAGGGLVARGHVRLTYGPQRASADVLRLNRARRTAELSGHVIFTDPRGRASGDDVTLRFTPDDQVSEITISGNGAIETPRYALSADRIVADRRAGRVLAEGHVSAFSTPDFLVTGDRATYDEHRQYGVVSGHAVVSNKAGRVRGGEIELFRADNRAVVHGPVTAEVYGATITAARATVDFKTSVAVFSGHAVMTRRQGTLSADRVTVFYKTRRMVAEGRTHATLLDLGNGGHDSAP
jgi:lipopolysaccharide assembly outer membrane protein LptD (OstA)